MALTHRLGEIVPLQSLLASPELPAFVHRVLVCKVPLPQLYKKQLKFQWIHILCGKSAQSSSWQGSWNHLVLQTEAEEAASNIKAVKAESTSCAISFSSGKPERSCNISTGLTIPILVWPDSV
jgi:hypothetical protein